MEFVGIWYFDDKKRRITIQKGNKKTMNTTILYTKHPADYTDIMKKSEAVCTLVTDKTKLPEELLQRRPHMLLMESDQTAPISFPVKDLVSNDFFTPSAVIYGEKDMLKKILEQNLTVAPSPSPFEIPEEFNRKLDKALMEFHFSPSLRGYHYLKQAFYYETQNARQISAVKKDIYEAVSNCYCTSIYSVERGITFSIRKAYGKAPEKFREIFTAQTKPPSNMQFLKTFFVYLKQTGLL